MPGLLSSLPHLALLSAGLRAAPVCGSGHLLLHSELQSWACAAHAPALCRGTEGCTASCSPGLAQIMCQLAAEALKAVLAGCTATFLLAAAVYSVSHACIGANPYAYVSDVMPADAAGLGLSMYRCSGDIGASPRQSLSCVYC